VFSKAFIENPERFNRLEAFQTKTGRNECGLEALFPPKTTKFAVKRFPPQNCLKKRMRAAFGLQWA
jgi:hypothetical protein